MGDSHDLHRNGDNIAHRQQRRQRLVPGCPPDPLEEWALDLGGWKAFEGFVGEEEGGFGLHGGGGAVCYAGLQFRVVCLWSIANG